MEKLTIAIVTKDRAESLTRCIESLLIQKKDILEVLVIDNSSRDNTREKIRSLSKELKLRYLYEKNVGIPFARNKALEEAKGNIVCFIDDDCEANRGWVEAMIKAHMKYPDAVAIQGYSVCKSEGRAYDLIDGKLSELWFKRYVSKSNEVFSLDTKNISLKKKLCKGILFDTSIIRGSDTDFGRQIFQNGKKIFFEKKAKVYFNSRHNLKDFLFQRILWGRALSLQEFKWGRGFLLREKKAKQIIWKGFSFRENPVVFMVNALSEIAVRLGMVFEKLRIYHDYSRLNREPLGKSKNINMQYSDTLSIMIITKDRYPNLKRCLLSLVKQTRKPDQVIIVDSSSKKKIGFLNNFNGKLKIEYIPKDKSGFSYQRNIALKTAVGEVGAIIDDDAEATNDWCENIIKFHKEYPQALAIQGKIINKSHNKFFSFLEQIRRDNWILKNLNYPGDLFVLTGNNSSFKLGKLKRLGIKFKDTKLHNEYDGEDMDLAMQIITKGRRILFCPTIIVKHWDREYLSAYLRQQYRIGCSAAILIYYWGRVITSEKLFLHGLSGSVLFFSRYFLDIFLHPLFRDNLTLGIVSLPWFYIGRYFTQKGIRDLRRKYLKS